MGLSKDEKKRLKEFEKLLGYGFKKREHLKRALTHKSFANEQHMPATEHNERYEYLGDAVLELSISHLLMAHFPNYPEGELSKLRAAVVNEAELAKMARAILIGEYLYLGKGEDRTGGREKPSLLSDAYEAVLGAVYLDRGFEKANQVIKKQFMRVLDEVGGVGFFKDYKTRLQEISQGKFKVMPRYRVVNSTGPDHKKTFEVNLFVKDELVGVGRGASKKAAEQDAAKQGLEKLGCNSNRDTSQ
jgi:ribonuclease III